MLRMQWVSFLLPSSQKRPLTFSCLSLARKYLLGNHLMFTQMSCSTQKYFLLSQKNISCYHKNISSAQLNSQKFSMINILKAVGLHLTCAQFVATKCLCLLAEFSCFHGVVMKHCKSQSKIYFCPCLCLIVKTVCKKLSVTSFIVQLPTTEQGRMAVQTDIPTYSTHNRLPQILLNPLTVIQSMLSTPHYLTVLQ